MRVALIGLGAIGRGMLDCLRSEREIDVCGALVARPQQPRSNGSLPLFRTLDELLAARPSLVVECASQRALRDYGASVLAGGCNLLLASVGALADESTYAALGQAARHAQRQVFIPAGALVGIDALASARRVGLTNVRYERRAPPATWIRSGAIGPERADAAEAFEIFSGSAREAALRFPKNANVAATLALAGIGFEATRVVLIADPAHAGNTHSVYASGAFGEFRTEIAARTLSTTSTSSMIVAGSLARAVTGLTDRIVV